MVAVTDGDRLLMTKYGDRPLPQWVLVSGFVEAGETLEEAAEREVFEETGIRIAYEMIEAMRLSEKAFW